MNRSGKGLNSNAPTVLWWSHSGRDYSRDRIIRAAFKELGWKIKDFRPTLSPAGHLEATLKRISRTDLVWVPCFRQRDVSAAQKWAKRNRVPLIFDPLISAWDKQVFERRKFQQNSRQSQRLLSNEAAQFRHSDLVIADTKAHAEFFCKAHGIPETQVAVIPVSAEESQFVPQPPVNPGLRRKILFYGSFIGLQGPQHIARAALEVRDADWTFIGTGPLLDECEKIARSQAHVTFLPRVPYEQLPKIIGEADILMGVFGDSPKAGRVIPNKVYQAIACGRPVVTRRSTAYGRELSDSMAADTGITWVDAGDHASIISAVKDLQKLNATDLARQGWCARKTYLSHFSNGVVKTKLETAIDGVAQASRSANAA